MPTNMQEGEHAPDHARADYVGIKSIKRKPMQPVYNMEVRRYHNFAVNGGLIVHNCIDSARYALNQQILQKTARTRSDVY